MSDNMPALQKTGIRSIYMCAAAAAAIFAYSTEIKAQAPDAAAEVGVWYDNTGKGAVEIAPCGAHLCGHIVWLKNPLNDDGKPLRDVYNPEPSRRSRSICGLQVLGELTRQADGTLDGGWVYDPKVGKAYNVQLTLKSNDWLVVHGYAGLKLLGKSLNWKRAKSKLPACDVSDGVTRAGQ